MLGMKCKQSKRPPISEPLRDAIRNSGVPVFRIAQDTGIDHRALGRFLDGSHVTTATADLLAERLGLVLVFINERGKNE
jgi:hypothetical protein